MCVTAHWIDENWYLQKRIISFEVMYESHSGINIKTRIVNVCGQWNLLDKLFTISVDNATANTKAIEYLISEPSFPKILNGVFFHVRCCAHVLNITAQDGLKELNTLIGPIREVIRWIRGKPECKNEYRAMCRQHGKKFMVVPLDCRTRWNTTYIMLSYAIKYRDILSGIYNTRVAAGQEVTTEQWRTAIDICALLKPFYDATKIFSLMYEPNVHQVLCQAGVIAITMKMYSDNPLLTDIIATMRTKWLHYFGEVPSIYTVAVLLDPTIGISGTRNLLEHYYTVLGIDYDYETYLGQCKDLLLQLYEHYNSIYNPNASRPTNIIPPSGSRMNPLIASVIYKKRGASSSSSSTTYDEVEDYLTLRGDEIVDFNILQWWRSKSDKYPILSRIARDILAIPASTIASESAFSAGRRVLDEKRSRLTPDNIQMCVCKKDWDQAERRTQGLKEQEKNYSDDPAMLLSEEEKE